MKTMQAEVAGRLAKRAAVRKLAKAARDVLAEMDRFPFGKKNAYWIEVSRAAPGKLRRALAALAQAGVE